MRRLLFFVVLVIFACLISVGCKSSQDEEQANAIKVWTGMDAEYPTLLKQCDEFTKATGIKVDVLKVPYNDLRNKFLIAAPAGLGPDLVLGPQDWEGALATAGMLDPIPEGTINEEEFFPVALDSVKFNGQTYQAPLCMECIAIFRNKDLIPERPNTMKELIEQAQKIQEESKGNIRGFYFEVKNLYFSLPFLTAEGSYLLGKDESGNYVPTDIGLDTPGTLKGVEFLRDLVSKYKLIPLGATNNISQTIFREGKAAMVVDGPWFLLDVKKDKKINYAIDPFPITDSGNIPKPVLGVQGFMLNKYAKHRDEAAKLISFLETDEKVAEMSMASGRPPAKTGSLELCKDNPDILSFAQICANATPMPTHPAVSQIWEPTGQSLDLITKGQVEPAAELKSNYDRIVQKIELMLE
ncbi:maltose ABC transporter substrate-binding protein [bacterium]|nr:maltose ABC transporter substrate-binding protein [bacterium]